MSDVMNQSEQWASSADRAIAAAWELKLLHDQWLSERDKFVDEWTAKREQYMKAIAELRPQQERYERWAEPATRPERVKEKLEGIASVDLSALGEAIPDARALDDPISEFDADDVWFVCRTELSVRPPKAFGRD
jgi:hypothetical protein